MRVVLADRASPRSARVVPQEARMAGPGRMTPVPARKRRRVMAERAAPSGFKSLSRPSPLLCPVISAALRGLLAVEVAAEGGLRDLLLSPFARQELSGNAAGGHYKNAVAHH